MKGGFKVPKRSWCVPVTSALLAMALIVPAGVWQGSLLEPGSEFALLGCTVAPGFEYADYESGDRITLTARFPAFAERIRQLTP